MHEGIAEDVHVCETVLFNVKLANVALAVATLFAVFVYRALKPVVSRDNILGAVDDVGQLSAVNEFILSAGDLLAELPIKFFIVILRESQLAGARVRGDGAVGFRARAVARRDAVYEDVVQLDRPEELVDDRVPDEFIFVVLLVVLPTHHDF